MPAIQRNPLQFNPNNLPLLSAAVYQRTIQASLERIWENVLDWEHLPHLHDTTFSYCELEEAGTWGWRTWSNAQYSEHIELCVGEDAYVARSYSGGSQTSEIWTRLSPQSQATEIRVEFFVAGVLEENLEKLGSSYLRLYRQLWDEDEAMMKQRQFRLSESRDSSRQINLGPEEEVRKRLPLTVSLARNEFQLCDIDGELKIVPTICPHYLGPLAIVDSTADRLRCPWHGYEFDRNSGDCLSPGHARCRLPELPRVSKEAGEVIVRV